MLLLSAVCAKAQVIDTLQDPELNFKYADSLKYSLESSVISAKSSSQRLREGSLAVSAIDVKAIANTITNVNDLVNRASGIKIRQEGGFGSDFEFYINGLSGNSVRYFIDGVPLSTKGEDVNINDIPVNTIDRIEVYKGVVPAQFGTDALGGVVNIVTKHNHFDYLDASVGGGSFHTAFADVIGQKFIGKNFYVAPSIKYSYSKNDYKMKDVEIWDESQRKYILTEQRRFHDRYQSILGQVEFGVKDASWSDIFSVAANWSKVDKQIQTGSMQNKVYGGAERNSHAYGLSLKYIKSWERVHARLNASQTWDVSETVDTTFRKYSWDGTWMPSSRNELRGSAKSIRVYNRPMTMVNGGLDYMLAEGHSVALNYMLNRTGNSRHDKVDKSFEPTDDALTKHIISLNYTQELFNAKMMNNLFVKDYINAATIEQRDDPLQTGAYDVETNTIRNYFGGGVGTRYHFSESFSMKASYEHSIRLPLARELLGNGTTVYPNLLLRPENSDNINLGAFGSKPFGNGHLISYEVGGFLRLVDDYIRAAVSEREGTMQYENVPAVHIKGVEGEVRYSWGSLQLSVNTSYVDARDMKEFKTDGKPSATYKNRVPNEPYFFGNGSFAYTFHNLISKSDRLRLCWYQDWIQWYYLTWEAYGKKESKAIIPTQNISSATVTYWWHQSKYSMTLEFNNIFDATAYDNYMLQKPGRSIMAKFRLYIN